MKFIHTSDWHLGRALYGHKRYAEYDAFLSWLLQTMTEQQVDALIVAGDIFDTSTPSNRAQEMYYRFLLHVRDTGCRHVVVVAGNHDSPSFLDAPKTLLHTLNVHVVGQASPNPADDNLALRDAEGVVEAVICAVPYLRERDLRTVTETTSYEGRSREMVAAVQRRYQDALLAAKKMAPHPSTPVIATGHLFAAGGKTVDDDGVRDLYVGKLEGMSQSVFPDEFCYVALGHLHLSQTVGGNESVRYSGAPIPMGFNEHTPAKQVLLVEPGASLRVTPIIVPTFQKLCRVKGDISKIEHRLATLVSRDESVWVEVEYSGEAIISNLKERIFTQIANSRVEVLRVQNRRVFNQVLSRVEQYEELSSITPQDVFQRLLEACHVSSDQRPALQALHDDILRTVLEQDSGSE